MGKAQKVKGEVIEAMDMVDLLQTLKDIADNRFYTLLAQRDKFRRFGETFVEFFRLVSFTEAKHPLISNKNSLCGIIVVTIEGSFLGAFNNKIIRRALEEKAKYETFKFIAVGNRSGDQLRQHTPDLKVITPLVETGLYERAVTIKDYLVDEIMNNRLGKVIVVYAWPRSFDTQKVRVLPLLPCEDLISKQAQFDIVEKVIEESEPSDVIGYLANLWITTRLYSILMDTFIASASAQANFLDDSLDKMSKESKKVRLKFRKAKKGDIDKSLRETFSARMMAMK